MVGKLALLPSDIMPRVTVVPKLCRSRVLVVLIVLTLCHTLFLWLKLSSLSPISSLHGNSTAATEAQRMVRRSRKLRDKAALRGEATGAVREENDKYLFGYVWNRRYAGQQGAGLLALISQQCWLQRAKLPMKIVEPFFRNSTLYGYPMSLQTKTDLRLRDLVDLEQFESTSHEQGLDKLISWEHFIVKSPRYIIVVLETDTGRERQPPEILWSRGEGGRECYSNFTEIPWMEIFARYNRNFCIVKIVNLRPVALPSTAEPIFTSDEMTNIIFGSWHPSQVILAFEWWCWHWDPWREGTDTRCSCREAIRERLHEKLVPSQQLVNYARDYEQRHSGREEGKIGGYTSIAVMMRVERVVLDELKTVRRQTEDTLLPRVESCLAQVVKVVRQLEYRRGRGRTLMMTDIGRFGSRSWSKRNDSSEETRKKIYQRVEHITMTTLLHSDLTFSQWEDSYVEVTGQKDPGYIAALQRVLASRADCLVLTGGGNFISRALEQYLHNHPHPCVHFVCLNQRYTKEYSQLIEAHLRNIAH